VHDRAQACTNVHKHARTCTSMHERARTCTSMHKHARSCTNVFHARTHEHTNTRNMHAQLLGGWRPSMGWWWWCSTPQVVVFRVSCFVHVRARSCMHAQLLGGWRTSRTAAAAAAASGAHGRTPLGVHQTKNGLLDRLPRTSTRRQERSGAHAR
jgi:hypothetical protein